MGVTHGKKTEHVHQNQRSGCSQPLIGPDLVSDLGPVKDWDQPWTRDEDLDRSKLLAEQTDQGYSDELIKPKKLHNPIKASKSHRQLQRELILSHKRGVMQEPKPELQRVLEQRKKAEEEKKQQEEKKSPLEQELLKRQIRLEKFEREWEEQEERSKGTAEFIRVKESLKHTAVISAQEKEL